MCSHGASYHALECAPSQIHLYLCASQLCGDTVLGVILGFSYQS